MTWQNGWQKWEALPGVELDVFHWSTSPNGKHALVTAGIHGDEYEGPAAVIDLAAQFDPAKLHGSFTAIPIANPPAYCAGTRTNPDGLNLARCFPGNRNGQPTEQLAAALFERLAPGTDFLIDLHSGGVEYRFLPVAGFYGAASPENPSFAAAQTFGLPALWQLPQTAGVLSCEMWKAGVVTIGNEFLGAGQLSEAGAAAYRSGVIRCLQAWGIYEGEGASQPQQQVLVGDWTLASERGLFRAKVTLGDAVESDQTVADILNPDGSLRQQLRASFAGIVGAIRNKAYINEGNWAVMVLKDGRGG